MRNMSVIHRTYLINYGGPAWIQGYWKKLLDNPPCKRPGDKRNKQFSYEFEYIPGKKSILYLHLVGINKDLDEVEKQLSKFKLARIESNNELTLILDAQFTFYNSIDYFIEFCRDHNYIIKAREIHQKELYMP